MKNVFDIQYIPFWVIFLSYSFKFLSWDIYSVQFSEDGLIEWIQFVLYFISSLLLFVSFCCFLWARNYYVGFAFLLLFLGVFFVAMEEISWGQRILDLQVPKGLQENNLQGELTLHNLGIFHRYFLHNIYISIGFLGFMLIQKPKIFYRIFSKKFIKSIAPAKSLRYYFICLAIFYFFLQYIYPVEKRLTGRPNTIIFPGDQEVFELILSMAVFVYAYSKLVLAKRELSRSVA